MMDIGISSPIIAARNLSASGLASSSLRGDQAMDICGHEEKSGKRAEGAYNDDDSEDNEEEKTCEVCCIFVLSMYDEGSCLC